MNPAGTVAYFAGAVSPPPTFLTTVYAHDLVSDVSLGVFQVEAGYHVQNSMPILGLSNGDVLIAWCKDGGGIGFIKRYDASGTFLRTYTLPGTNPTPINITPGVDERYSVWVGFRNAAATTSSGVTIAELRLSDGAILPSFNPDDGGFDFSGPFCVLSEDIGTPTSGNPPDPKPKIPTVVCIPSRTIEASPKRSAGCNQGGRVTCRRVAADERPLHRRARVAV